eukprot:2148760-Pyramimonas_sp.AAC.1
MLPRPKKGVTWTEHPGLSEKEREQAIIAAERLIVRHELGQAGAESAKANLTKGKKASSKAKVASWFGKGLVTTVVTAWAHKTWGGAAAAFFVGWRLWRWLHL